MLLEIGYPELSFLRKIATSFQLNLWIKEFRIHKNVSTDDAFHSFLQIMVDLPLEQFKLGKAFTDDRTCCAVLLDKFDKLEQQLQDNITKTVAEESKFALPDLQHGMYIQIVKGLSTSQKAGAIRLVLNVSERGDFTLNDPVNGKQTFGFAYRAHIKILEHWPQEKDNLEEILKNEGEVN